MNDMAYSVLGVPFNPTRQSMVKMTSFFVNLAPGCRDSPTHIGQFVLANSFESTVLFLNRLLIFLLPEMPLVWHKRNTVNLSLANIGRVTVTAVVTHADS